MRRPRRQPAGETGFSLIETMIALGLLAGGLLALAQVFTAGLGALGAGGADIIARQKAIEAIESVYAARDTRTVPWAGIRNAADGGRFLDGDRPLTTAGADGLLNTNDDGAVEAVTQPGPDGVLDTDDDITQPLARFTRRIDIIDIDENLRRIRVTICYLAGGTRREYVLETLISSFA